jgi:hypothetical protein
MATSALSAHGLKLMDVLRQDDQLSCPMFQRTYDWERKQRQQLWDDLDTLRDGTFETRFLGALVFDSDSEPRATYAGTKWIIDGQQRLTTLFLLLIAVAAKLGEIEDGESYATDLVSQYLVGHQRNTKKKPKVTPTFPDYAQMNQILGTVTALGMDKLPLAMGPEAGPLTLAFDEILGEVEFRVASELTDDRLKKLIELMEIVLERVEFVEIVLGPGHDSNEVFDRLNSTGRSLDDLDLIRNEVLRHAKDDVKLASDLYDNHWLKFEQAFSPDSRKGYFFPFALTRDSGITKARTFHSLANRWREEFKGLDDPRAQTLLRIEDLSEHQDAYLALVDGIRLVGLSDKSELWRAIAVLRRLGFPSVSLSYLMPVVTLGLTDPSARDRVVQCLKIIESFLLRRAIVGMEPTGLHAIFKKMWGAAWIDPAKVRSNLVSGTIEFPNDQMFSRALETGDLYHRKVNQFVLGELERSIVAGDPLPIENNFSIDHVLPQTLPAGSDWSKLWTQKQHEKWLHTFANLVPLSQKANSEKSNRSWEATRKFLGTNTYFKTTQRFFKDYKDWTPVEVQARAKELSAWGLTRWPEK